MHQLEPCTCSSRWNAHLDLCCSSHSTPDGAAPALMPSVHQASAHTMQQVCNEPTGACTKCSSPVWSSPGAEQIYTGCRCCISSQQHLHCCCVDTWSPGWTWCFLHPCTASLCLSLVLDRSQLMTPAGGVRQANSAVSFRHICIV